MVWASRTAYFVQSGSTAGRRLGRIDAVAASTNKRRFAWFELLGMNILLGPGRLLAAGGLN